MLLVDDDKFMCHGIATQLSERDVVCDTVHFGDECLNKVRLQDYDVILLDLILPDVSGYELLKSLRMKDINIPVLILSTLSDVERKVQGFDYGADDYLSKPFCKEELFARVDALVRRSKGHSGNMIKIGELSINMKDKYAEVNGIKLSLTNKEYTILELLALHKGSTLHKDVFFSHLYCGIDVPEAKIIDVFVCKIRRKIQKLLKNNHDYIRTVWGRGYVLEDIAA